MSSKPSSAAITVLKYILNYNSENMSLSGTTQKYNQRNNSIKRSVKTTQKSPVTLFIILFLIVIVVFGAFIYVNFFKLNTVTISGFNWKESSIYLLTENLEREILPGQSYAYEVQVRDRLVVTFEDENRENIREEIYEIYRDNAYILTFTSDLEENQCVIKTDATNIYYRTDDGDTFFKDLKLLEAESVESAIYYAGDDDDTKYIAHPGRYSPDLFPNDIPTTKKVTGIYFVGCENLGSDETLLSDILGSVYYGQTID